MKLTHTVPNLLSIKNTLYGKGVHFFTPDDDPDGVLTLDKIDKSQADIDTEAKATADAETARLAAESADKAKGADAEAQHLAAEKKTADDAAEAVNQAKLADIEAKVKSGEYKIDAKGDLVNSVDNTVIKTKTDIDAEGSADVGIISKIATDFGYEFKDENGAVKTYEETETGLVNFWKDAKEHERQGAVKEVLDFPIYQDYTIKDILAIQAKGGDLKDIFAEEVDYSKVKFDDKNEQLHKDILSDYYASKGIAEAKANELVERAKAAGKLKEDSQDALKELQDGQVEGKKAKMAQLEAEDKARINGINTYWKGVKGQLVDKGFLPLKKGNGEITNISIPVIDREPFLNYISKNVNGKGKSQAIIDFEAKSGEEKMLIDYLFGFKKLNIDDFIDEKLKQKQAKNLKDILRRSTPSDKGAGQHFVNTHDVSENPDDTLK
jgi:anti-sigma28 factor (negative regulator of flagellin synthesis)